MRVWQTLQRKVGNEKSREGRSRRVRVNPVMNGVTGKNKKLPETYTLRNYSIMSVRVFLRLIAIVAWDFKRVVRNPGSRLKPVGVCLSALPKSSANLDDAKILARLSTGLSESSVGKTDSPDGLTGARKREHFQSRRTRLTPRRFHWARSAANKGSVAS